MTPELLLKWCRLHLDWMHNTVDIIGMNVAELDSDDTNEAMREFKQQVRTAIRIFRFKMKIPYTE